MMKTNAIFLFLLMGMLPALRSQDTIEFMNGNRLAAYVTQITATTIQYKKADNFSGPLYITKRRDVLAITHRNGYTEMFGQPTVPVATAEERPAPDKGQEMYPPRIKFNGPRFGLTFVGPGTAATYITEQGKTPMVTQFGWQFETRFFATSTGLSGLVEFVPLVGGLEQGMFLPSMNLMVGLRDKEGREFAMGPNISLTGLGMAFAVGASFHVDEIYFPVNLAFVPSINNKVVETGANGQETEIFTQTGMRVSLLIGFNQRKKPVQ